MNGYLPQKDLIFFSPGEKGVVFTHAANHYISVNQLLHAQEYLVKETQKPVVYIEDRRQKPRLEEKEERTNA